MRYRDGLPLALEAVDLSVAAGSMAGVVGRTGAGKSSLLAGGPHPRQIPPTASFA